MPDLNPRWKSRKGDFKKKILCRGGSAIHWLPPILWYGVIFWFSSRTTSELPSNIPDFLPHFGEFLILGFLLARAFRLESSTRTVTVFVVLIVLALGDECHQLFVPTRMFSIEDILVDALGAAAGMVVFSAFGSGGKPGPPAA